MTVYRRKFDCAVCGAPVTARKVINGYIVSCECGEIFREDAVPSEHFVEAPA